MCPPYCNESIPPLKLWLVSASGLFFAGDKRWWKNSVLKSHLSCQRADTGHPGTPGLQCTESGHWPSFPSPSTQPANPPALLLLLKHPTYKYCSAASSHLFFTVSTTWANSPPAAPPARPFILTWYFWHSFFRSLFVSMPIITHLKNRKHIDSQVRSGQERQLDG